MREHNPKLDEITERMRAEELPPLVIDTFSYYYEMFVSGSTGLIPEEEICPVEAVPDMEMLPVHLADAGREALERTVIIKLNGGLGTSMGLEKAKSLLPVKDGYSFLDIIAHQAIDAGVPLLLMNSFSTDADSPGELRLTYQSACGTSDNNLYFGRLGDVASHGWSGVAM